MKRSTRRRIFYGLCGLFLLGGSLTVFYAQGYRLDTKTLTVKKVGAIYLRTFPKETNVAVDNKSIKETLGFLSSGRLINDLFPKNYLVQVASVGYHSWKTKVEVQPSVVSELKSVVLVPVQGTISRVGVTNFFLENGALGVALGTSTIELGEGRLPGGTLIDALPAEGLALVSSRDKSHIILYSGAGTASTTLIAKNGYAPLLLHDATMLWHSGKNILAISPTENNSREVIAVGKNEHLETLTRTASGAVWNVFNERSKTSKVVFLNGASSTPVFGRITNIAEDGKGILHIREENGDYLLYAPPTGKFEKIASGVEQFAISPDGTRTAAVGKDSMEIIPLEKGQIYSRFNLKEKNVQEIIWYGDNEHLFLRYENHTTFFDLHDNSLENLTIVATTTAAGYDSAKNRFYALYEGKLTVYDFPR